MYLQTLTVHIVGDGNDLFLGDDCPVQRVLQSNDLDRCTVTTDLVEQS